MIHLRRLHKEEPLGGVEYHLVPRSGSVGHDRKTGRSFRTCVKVLATSEMNVVVGLGAVVRRVLHERQQWAVSADLHHGR